jgi:hypothetical protein
MHSTKWKKLKISSIFVLCIFKFNMNFIPIDKETFIDLFYKFDNILLPMNLYFQLHIFSFCKLNSCIFLDSWTHKNLINIFIISIFVWKYWNYGVLFFIIFCIILDKSLPIVFGFTLSIIIINVSLSFL